MHTYILTYIHIHIYIAKGWNKVSRLVPPRQKVASTKVQKLTQKTLSRTSERLEQGSQVYPPGKKWMYNGAPLRKVLSLLALLVQKCEY